MWRVVAPMCRVSNALAPKPNVMSQPSSIEQIPEALRSELQKWLRDPAVTQKDATERLNYLLAEHGLEITISRSAVNRYARRMDKAGAKIRESRAVAKMWIAELGAQPQGQVGHLLNELVRTIAFDSVLKLGEGDTPVAPKSLRELATAIQRLEQATTMSVKREELIREQTKKQAAEAARNAGKRAGVNSETLKKIEQEVLGLS